MRFFPVALLALLGVAACAPSDSTLDLFWAGSIALAEGGGGAGGSSDGGGGAGELGGGGATGDGGGETCACDDRDPCNGIERCINGGCIQGMPPAELNDHNVCTDDVCHVGQDGEVLITHENVNVDDGNPCTNDNCDRSTGPFHTPIPDCEL
jgi:hypothetical protein